MRASATHKNETWGLMIDWIVSNYTKVILDDVARYCREQGISLVIFTTGPLSYTLDYDPLKRHLSSFVESAQVDRLMVIPPQLSRNAGSDFLTRFFSESTPKPIVCLGAPIGKLPSVVADVAQALGTLLDHLYDHHGYRRFAWVSGPPDNPESSERERVVQAYLKQKGLPLRPELCFRGDFNMDTGRDAGRHLLPLRSEWDVVVSANDTMAMGLKQILGPSAPITGFDNAPEARIAGLTTIDSQLSEQVTLALNVLAKQDVTQPVLSARPSRARLGRLVVRDSCGCRNTAVEAAAPGPANEMFTHRLGGLSEHILRCVDMEELASILNEALAPEGIDYWRLIPPIEADDEAGGLTLQPTPALPAPSVLVVHSLFQDKQLFGFLVHDGKNRDDVFSEWLRLTLCLVIPAWRSRNHSIEVQKVLATEIDKFSRRRQDIESTLNSLPVWIIEVDRHLRLRYLNHRASELLGLGASDGRNTTLLEHVDLRDRPILEPRLKWCMKERSALGVQFSFVTRQGAEVPVVGEAQPLKEEPGSNLATLFGSMHFGGGVRLTGLALAPIVEGIADPEPLLFKHFDLSPREREVVTWLARGLENGQIADKLGQTEATVRVQLHRIYGKTGVNRRQELLELLAEYQARSGAPHSVAQALMAQFFTRSQ